jgi:hypothetical protein
MTDDGQRSFIGLPKAQGLYLPEFERDACGVGFVCHIKGKASHSIIGQRAGDAGAHEPPRRLRV